MNLDALYIIAKDPHVGTRRYLVYKQTAVLNDWIKDRNTRGFFNLMSPAPVGSFKVICKGCLQQIPDGKVVRVTNGWNFLVSCKCGRDKKFSVVDPELVGNESLIMAYLKVIYTGYGRKFINNLCLKF